MKNGMLPMLRLGMANLAARRLVPRTIDRATEELAGRLRAAARPRGRERAMRAVRRNRRCTDARRRTASKAVQK